MNFLELIKKLFSSNKPAAELPVEEKLPLMDSSGNVLSEDFKIDEGMED